MPRMASRALTGSPLTDDVRRPAPVVDELAALRRERDRYMEQLSEAEGERNHLRARLRDALEQLEHWRTLAEYREAMRSHETDTVSGRRIPDLVPVERST